MPAVNWTHEQEAVITTRGHNLLVSAAAGSGKTAVLTARILSRILDEKDPADIDELLVVTFTKAAAGELRERIMRELARERELHPGDEHLARQSALLPGAMITTIDGFCSYVVRSYGHRIGLMAGSRIAESGESELLKQDALSSVLEEAYADPDPSFRERMDAFVETFAWGKHEKLLERAIFRMAGAADGGPDPEGFLSLCGKDEEIENAEQLFALPWMQELMREAAGEVFTGLTLAEANMEAVHLPDGPSAYMKTAEADLKIFQALSGILQRSPVAAAGYDECRKLLTEFQGVNLSKKRPEAGEDPEKREVFKRRHGETVSIRKRLIEEFFPASSGDAAAFVMKSAGPVRTLVMLTRRYRARYAEMKEKRRVMDFSDLEHDALRILVEDGRRTYAAKELASRFKEVMIDEYQDSNYLQEAILTAVSRVEDGEPNYICVGDIKQSIYSFRQARPELFMEKYDRYASDTKAGMRIDLHRNFRSGQEVIDSVNGIFREVMQREIGGVDYDEEAELLKGAAYAPNGAMKSELLLLFTGEGGEDGPAAGGKVGSLDAREMEARMIGGRIRELVAEGEIEERDGTRRRIEYRDIVILLRTMEGWADTFVHTLEGMRIPVFSTAKSGYFTAPEVTALMNYLTILDNPQQDIPFAAVLGSAFVMLDAKELALIRTADQAVSFSGSANRSDISLCDAARAYAADRDGTADAALRNKLLAFFELYDSLRAAVPDTPLHELIGRLLAESGFYEAMTVLPGGAKRALNLRMLSDKAVEYEQTSYIGLFNFVRYIENLKKYNQDFGELSEVSEQANVVRIYSIHKSKGLEFPVVFAAGTGKPFNLQELGAELLIHPQLRAASYWIDYKKRTKAPSLHRQAIRRRLLGDSLGEELRVLYVAYTRAMCKLIITGTCKNEEKLNELSGIAPGGDGPLPVSYIGKCRDALHLICPAAQRANEKAHRRGEGDVIALRTVTPADLADVETAGAIRREDVLTRLKEMRSGQVFDPAVRKTLEERFSWQYPYPSALIPVEVSVSELKKAAMRAAENPLTRSEEAGEAGAEELFPEEIPSPLVPDFYRKMHSGEARAEEGKESPLPGRGALSGAERGTAYHRVFELLSFKAFKNLSGEESVLKAAEEEIRRMASEGKLTEEEAVCVDPRDIAAFAKSSLGRRMAAAEERGSLFREQPFVLGVDASFLNEEWPEDETVFVQGIIDAFFYEDGEIVLMDYKTDRVKDSRELTGRYRVQLDSYARALSRVLDAKVKEKIIWSVALASGVVFL